MAPRHGTELVVAKLAEQRAGRKIGAGQKTLTFNRLPIGMTDTLRPAYWRIWCLSPVRGAIGQTAHQILKPTTVYCLIGWLMSLDRLGSKNLVSTESRMNRHAGAIDQWLHGCTTR